ncbi:MAG TPA: tripartite tricarboxylate transporter substrate-binding protein [Alphaproteobacteria bacterium]|jgi:tripartite-type tricarboxylate transporter receptor subunit TctC
MTIRRLSAFASICITAFLGTIFSNAGAAQAQDAPYKGKQVRMVIASGAGGGYDTYARVLSRHMPRYIPGNPNFVDQNMPGASGVAATVWGAKAAPKDGSVIVSTYNALLLEPLFGNSSTDYDPREYEWVGSIGKQQNICVTWHTNPIKTIDQAKQQEVKVSSTGATGNSGTLPKIVNAMLGTKFKIIGGYTTSESRLAVERGEVDGICGLSWATLKASNPDWIQNKRMNILLQTGETAQAELPDVPLLYNLVSKPEDKQVLKLLFVSEDMGRPFGMPPGTPKALVEIMRKGFDATMKDKQFLAEADKAQMEVDPVKGADMQKILADVYATPKALVDKASDFLGRQTAQAK